MEVVYAAVLAAMAGQPRILKEDPAPTIYYVRSSADRQLEVIIGFSAAKADIAPAKSDLLRAVYDKAPTAYEPSIMKPPSTASVWPVMKWEASLARNTRAGAMSVSGSPILPPSGIAWAR